MSEQTPFYVQKQAMKLVNDKRPNASGYKRAAFANSVAYLVTGASGGYGGPSVREHTASQMYGPGGAYTFEEAVELLLSDEGPIFGPLTDVHRFCWENEHCFDDDPEDKAELGLK